VSYDRARVLEEYGIASTKTRFIDTMALHVAVKGISSHQRPAWNKHRKLKVQAKVQLKEAAQVVEGVVEGCEHPKDEELDEGCSTRVRSNVEENLPQLQTEESDITDAEMTSKRWEEITSANALADVARLHCGIEMEKDTRDDFMTHSPAQIREDIHTYLSYCAHDVFVTHAVFKKVLPDFLAACPHPVSFAGILTMGSSFLTVDESWKTYLENAERKYREMEEKVKKRLIELANEAKGMMESGRWKGDAWLSQLDWSPKVASKSRGVFPSEVSCFQTLSAASQFTQISKICRIYLNQQNSLLVPYGLINSSLRARFL
jgi:DNA polymerase gamma 1